MQPLGMQGGVAGENWAAPAAGSAGDDVGEAEGLTCDQFVAGVRVGDDADEPARRSQAAATTEAAAPARRRPKCVSPRLRNLR
jgi:hypothetical protein